MIDNNYHRAYLGLDSDSGIEVIWNSLSTDRLEESTTVTSRDRNAAKGFQQVNKTKPP